MYDCVVQHILICVRFLTAGKKWKEVKKWKMGPMHAWMAHLQKDVVNWPLATLLRSRISAYSVQNFLPRRSCSLLQRKRSLVLHTEQRLEFIRWNVTGFNDPQRTPEETWNTLTMLQRRRTNVFSRIERPSFYFFLTLDSTVILVALFEGRSIRENRVFRAANHM